MRIKKLHLHGFKSFADPTDLYFKPTITAVVGPNGCGKSNVIDAIKWCMGEQSARLLRGQSMEDVIFNGSETRKPLGMAEVSITFDIAGTHKPLHFEQYEEIEITRRLYRNGDSEYLINKSPARLRDIQELFMDTGVGARAYSIIEQGQIGALVNAKPEDRRFLIEEAAGITKFKKRKEEALRKMEDAKHNLERIGDVARELKRQLNRLDREAKRAEKYKELELQARKIEASLLHARHTELAAELAQTMAEVERLRAEEARLAAAESEHETQAETRKLAIAQLEKEVATLKDQALEAGQRMANHERDLEIDRNRLSMIERQIANLERELQNADARRHELEIEITQTQGAVEALEQALAEREDAVRVLEARLPERQKTLEDLAARYEVAGQQILDLSQRFTEQRTQLESARARRDELIRRMEDTQAEVDEFRQALEESAERAAQAAKARDEAESERVNLLARREKLANELAGLQQEHQALLPRVEEARRVLQEKQSRLQSLRELEAAHEGMRDGVRQLLALAKTGPTAISGVLADAVEPSAGLEAALAGYLGDRLEALVISDRNAALQAIRYLQEGEGRGRAVFLPDDLQLLTSEPVSGVRLSERIRFKGPYGTLAKRIFDQVLLAESDEDALRLWAQNPGFAVVSPQGLVVYPDGSIAGGSEDKGTALLRQKREAIELEEEIERRQAALKSLNEEIEAIQSRRQWLEEEIESVRTAVQQAELAVAGLQKDQANAEAERNRLTRELEALDEEVTGFQADMDGITDRIREVEQRLIEANRQREAAVAARDELAAHHAKAKLALDELIRELSQCKVELADTRGTLGARREQLARLLRERQNMHELDRRADLELEASRRERDSVRQRIEAAAGGTGDLVKRKMELEQATIEAVERYEIEKAKLMAAETQVREARREHESIRQSLQQHQLHVAELQKDLDHVRQLFAERFQTAPEALPADQMDTHGTLDERQRRLEDIRRKMAEMGDVNRGAAHEYQEIQERYKFIEEQQRDLLDSLDALEKAIAKINKTSRERFLATFEIINEKFKLVFPRLFNGGHAELRLTEDENLLESGVEIIAQPPGKRLQRVNLLSGGEKALTAVALIFAIFLLKPSPFCLLDEVDAPLDDANIDRFNALLEEMNRLSQIIMITHNKRTMEIGHELYGVTMEEKGVSRVVSVKLE